MCWWALFCLHHYESDILRQIALPELPHIFQIAPVVWGNLNEAISVVRPDISQVHSLMLGQSGKKINAKKWTGVSIMIIQTHKVWSRSADEVLVDHK